MNRTALIAGALFLVTLSTRIPFGSGTLWAWDSVLYARALEDGFHVDYVTANQRPHPPGYLFYIAIAAFTRYLTGDSNRALVALSMVASALAAAGLFLLARQFASDRSAVLAAIGFALNPLVWQYSEVAYPYALLGLLSILLAMSFKRARGRGTNAALIAGATFGALGGFRQDLLLFFAPAWIWAVAPLSWRTRAAAAAAVLVGCLTWLAPTALLSNGFQGYADAVIRQTDFVRATHSVPAQGWPALATNLSTTGYAIAWGLGLFVVPVVAFAVAVGSRTIRDRRVVVDRPEALLIAWLVPALLFYAWLHIGEWGYVLSVLPALYVVAARALDRATMVPRGARRLALTAGLVGPASVFAIGPAPFSASAIAQHDWELSSRVSYVREHYPPDATLLLAREDFLLVRYYLPEYRTWFHDRDPYRTTFERRRAPSVDAIVVFTPRLQSTSAAAIRVTCGKGVELVYLAIEREAVIELHDDQYTIVAPPRPSEGR